VAASVSADSNENCDPAAEASNEVDETVEEDEPKPAVFTPSYSYREDQWSPYNTSGVKSYDKSFMLAARVYATEPPQNLVTLEELEQKKREKARNSSQSQSRDGNHGDFTPSFVRSAGGQMGGHRDNKGGYSGQMHRGSNSMRGAKKAHKVIDAKPNAGKINLKTTDNAWVPISKQSTSVDEEAKLLRSMRGLMNKICPENYDKLKDPFREMILKNNSHMKALVNLIFDKAVLEQHFAGEYAKLCKYVVDKVTPNDKNQVPPEIQHFRNSLLLKCQQEFEKRHKEEAQRQSDIQKSRDKIAKCQNSEEKTRLEKEHEEKFVDKVAVQREKLSKEIEECENKEKKKMLEEELETLDDATRRKSVGLIKYVAELYKQGLLSYRTILGLFKDLVKDIHRSEQAEILCKLFITIGGLLWKQVDENGKRTIKTCMSDIKEHSQVVKDSRIKFMLLDVLDLYDNSFIAKHRSQKQVGPTTKKQVLENMSVEQQQMEKQTAAAAAHTSGNRHSEGKYGGRYDHRGSNSRDSFNQESTHVWKMVVNSSQGGSKRSFTRHTPDSGTEHQRLGPGGGGYSIWSRGASGGASGSMKDSPRNNTGSNPMRSNRFGVYPEDDDLGGPELQPRHPMAGPRANPFTKNSNSDMDGGRDMRGAYGDSRDQMRGASLNDRGNNMGRNSFQSGDIRNKSLNRDTMNLEPHSGAMYQPNKVAPVPQREESPPMPALSDEQLKTMVLSTVEEYCGIREIKEVILDIEGKIKVQNLKMFVYFTMYMYFEKKPKEIETIGILFNELFNEVVLNETDFLEGIKILMPEVSELAVDVPQLAQNFGTMIAPSLISGHLKLKDIWSAVQGADHFKIKLFCHTLNKMAGLGEDETVRLWVSSDLKWEEIFKVEKKQRPYDIPAELKDYRLDFLPISEEEPMSDYYHQWCVKRNNVNLQDSKSVKAFVTELIQTAVKGSDSNAEIDDFEGLCDRVEGLKKYFEQEKCDNRQQVELSVLYAMQAIAYNNGMPKGLLETMFEAAHTTTLVSLNSFSVWESSDNSEEPGQGVCVTSLKNFFRTIFNKAPIGI
jgi:uncharacterized protein YqgQ